MITRLTNSPIGSLLTRLILLTLLVVKIFNLEDESLNIAIYSFIKLTPILDGWIIKIGILLSYLFSILLLLRINDKHRFVEFDTSPLWLFVITGFNLIPLEMMQLNVAVSMLLNIIALRVLLKIYHQPNVGSLIFGSSFLIALGSILFYPSIIFLLLVIATLIIFRPFNLKNYILIIVGFLLPLFHLASINYLTENNWLGEPSIWVNRSVEFPAFKLSSMLFWCFLPLTAFSLFKMITSQAKFVVRQRNQLIVVYLFIVLTFVEALAVHIENLLFFLLLPLGLFYNYWYQSFQRKWLLDTILVTLIITSLFVK